MIANRWSAPLLLYGGDRASMSQFLMQRLWQRGLHLLTGIGRTRKTSLMSLLDKLLPRQPSIMETLFAQMKSGMGLEHSRHRSPIHDFIHILSCLAAHSLGQTKDNMGIVHIPALSPPCMEKSAGPGNLSSGLTFPW